MSRHMNLGLSLRRLGYHIAGWRLPEVDATAHENFAHYLNSARIAEEAGFDFIFFADAVAHLIDDEPYGSAGYWDQHVELEPLTLLAALAASTTHIGLIATASTTYNEPYHIARKFASIDHISGGRAGWNIVTSWSEKEALNFSRQKHLDHETRYRRAKEFVDVVTGLWGSWEKDAFVRDKISGIFADMGRMKRLNHSGAFFQVQGPLTASRTPQGRPVLVHAGASPVGQEIAASRADLVYTNEYDMTKAQYTYSSLKRQACDAGRTANDIKVLPGIQPFVGRTQQEAREKFERLQDLVHPMVGLGNLFGFVGDLSAYDVDKPIPDDFIIRANTSNSNKTLELARSENLTIRQLYQRIAGKAGIRQIIGTAKEIADDMEQWFTAEACDGFNICPSHTPDTVSDFAEQVIPELQRRGLFRKSYESTKLRENLGLPAL